MVKFLTGTTFDGEQVPECTYWSRTSTTSINEDYADFESEASSGRCVANHFFARDEISCYNQGQCNGQGKCLPCTKYKYPGMRMGISHSPPLEFFRQFNKGITEADILGPQLRAVGDSVTTVAHDQIPFHILLRNIQAEIAKCCRWSIGNGEPSKFIITPIIDGPDTITITNANGNPSQLKGIRVTHPAFPDNGTSSNPEGGSFFPVGLTVVAGWEDEPSFYLEPRTGLVKNGEGVVFRSSGQSTALSNAKSQAASASKAAENGQSAIDYCLFQANQLLAAEINFANNLLQSNAPPSQQENAANRVAEKQASVDAIVAAQTEAASLKSSIDSGAAAVVAASSPDDIIAAATALANNLDLLAAQVDIANSNAGGAPASDAAAQASRILRALAQQLRFSGSGGFTKCELAFTPENSAAQWNSPTDGSLPCNGVRTDCKFYTGPSWQFATTEKMEIGKPVLAEAIQEIRYYSDDWSRFSNPEEEFKSRFSVPFIWAFKDYINVGGTPFIEDMLLYKPKTVFARRKGNPNAPDDNPTTLSNSYETMRLQKVEISDFENFAVSKTLSRIQPGQEVLDQDRVPSFASKITQFNVPTAVRLNITHPPTDENFIYRTWSPRFTNRISMFGNASPSSTIYLVNNTALKERNRYHTFFGSKNIASLPSGGLPGASSNFVGIAASQLKAIFDELEEEKASNQSEAVLGFDITSSDTTGFWSSFIEVDVVHNQLNEIFAFIIINDSSFVFDKATVDYRCLHSIVTQTSFTSTDFTIHDAGGPTGGSKLGVAAGDQSQSSLLTATSRQILGSEPVTVDYGYYAWRFKDRNLNLTVDNDATDIQSSSGFVTEADASTFIANVGYRVVQYKEEEQVSDWYLLQDCGIIMAKLSSPNIHRVLPLPDQSGEIKALSNVLINNGATGSVVAPWAPEKITLNIAGEDKDMVLIYRSEEGIGLPANYIICGPAPGAENLFGRPDPTRDSLTVQYTYLRPQSHKQRSEEEQSEPEGTGDVVTENFYGDDVREHTQNIVFTSQGLVAGGERPNNIALDQQDYCFVFKDSDSRPIGRKVVRFLVSYYNLACINIEIFYAWRSQCVTYALVPDLFLAIGTAAGQTSAPLKATVNPDEPGLSLGFRVSNLLGEHGCGQVANCGDHEILRLGPLRKEFEVIAETSDGSEDGEESTLIQKAFFPSAGQPVTGKIISAEPPGTQWQKKRGTLWYPYNICERPRYQKNTNGPLNTDSTELINEQTKGAGAASGEFGVGTFEAGGGEFGGLPPQADEAYRGYDDVSAKVLDTHPSLRPCTSAFTYGNVVRVGGSTFRGYARKRGEIDTFWYTGFQWDPPPFGNFGRSLALCELSHKVGDYSPGGQQKGFRWMPLFPERDDLGAAVGLFGEGPDPEPVLYRLIGSQTPLGGVGEVVPDGQDRYTHTSLVGNKTSSVTYPHVPYFPTFLPDNLLGLEPVDQGIVPGGSVPAGTITTGWAWREVDKAIFRGQNGSDSMQGLSLLLPDYFLNNQRMEVRLRPPEEDYVVTYTAPQYSEDGSITKNGELKLGDGPPREIIIDFNTRTFGLAQQPGTVYDTSLLLGESPFVCTPQFSSNPTLASQCSCDGTVDEESDELPAIIIHADSLAPTGYFALYSTTEMGQPFPTDIAGATAPPRNICNYFLEHIYFRLDATFLPLTPRFDPLFSSSVTTQMTWSRVPHGQLGGASRGDFRGEEPRAQGYQVPGNTSVLKTRPFNNQTRLSKSLVTTYWPSPQEAAQALQDSTGIVVPAALAAGDPKLLGGVPTVNNTSRGQSEQITLDVAFDTYVSMRTIRIWFLAGEGMQVPSVTATFIPPQFRTGNFPTVRTGVVIGTSTVTTNGRDIPNSENFSQAAINAGEALFQVTISPAITEFPFWDKFAQEFHLIFAERDDSLSMGIHSIEFEVDALLPTASVTETIRIPERKYYRSTFTPISKNPEEQLSGVDNATGYWRNTTVGADSGANRSRAYAWGPKINNESGVGQGGGNPTIPGEPEELEKLQAMEYNSARALMSHPYQYTLTSFFPIDEQNWLNFLGGSQPAWTTSLTNTINDIDKVSDSSGNLIYGEIPQRSRWNAPGHSWIHTLEDESYARCCEGCGFSQVVNYEFIHLHDNLDVVETAAFWDEMPSGLLKGVRSIMDSPDVVILDENQLLDAQGEPISAEVLEESGIARDPDTGQLIIQ